MPALKLGGGSGDLARFRRLVNVTAISTFALIVIGGIVRVSDSGLGCGPAGSGTHGWPLCEGEVLPLVGGISGTTLIEFSHRAVAAIVGVLALWIAVLAWRRLRDHRNLVRGSIFAAVLVLAQAGLGGLTVEHNLHSVLVAAHLGLAMIFLATLIALSHGASARRQPREAEAPRERRLPEATPALRTAAIVAAMLILATIVAGGYVAGTEGEGTAAEPALGAHLACGQEFPTCVGRFMPFGIDGLIDAQLTHRLLMYLASIAVLATLALALRAGVRDRIYPVMAGLLVAQVTLGALNVWLGKHAGLIVGHLTLGTLLWTSSAYAAMLLMPSTRASAESRARRHGPEPAAA